MAVNWSNRSEPKGTLSKTITLVLHHRCRGFGKEGVLTWGYGLNSQGYQGFIYQHQRLDKLSKRSRSISLDLDNLPQIDQCCGKNYRNLSGLLLKKKLGQAFSVIIQYIYIRQYKTQVTDRTRQQLIVATPTSGQWQPASDTMSKKHALSFTKLFEDAARPWHWNSGTSTPTDL